MENLEGLTSEEAIKLMVEALPKDMEAFKEKIDREIPDNMEEAEKKLDELAKTDPEFYEQIHYYFYLKFLKEAIEREKNENNNN